MTQRSALDALRSLIFYAVYSVSVAIYSAIMVVFFSPLPYPMRYRMVTLWNRFAIWWVRICCGVRYTISGIENLPARACVVVSNHQSSWETIFLATLFPQLSILLKRELLRIPLFGWALALTRPIAIDRASPRAALKQMVETGARRLASGCSVLVFPEGTRVSAGQAIRFSRGAAQLAIQCGVDLVCVAHDAGKCWPPPRRLSKTPGRINVVIRTPLASAGQSAEALTTNARNWIAARVAEFAYEKR